MSFCYTVPLGQTTVFESVYQEALRLDPPEKEEIRNVPGSIFAWLFIERELVGESYGIPLISCDEPIPGLAGIGEREKETGLYCYSNTILPHFQRRGLGTILKAHWLGLAAGKGFDAVYGHARPGGSYALNSKFGAVYCSRYPDWYGTGEDYWMYRLALAGPWQPTQRPRECTRGYPLA